MRMYMYWPVKSTYEPWHHTNIFALYDGYYVQKLIKGATMVNRIWLKQFYQIVHVYILDRNL